MAGALYGQYQMFISPDTVSGIAVSLQMVFAVVVGGIYVALGPTVGAIITIMLAEVLRIGFGTKAVGWDNLVYGVLLVAVHHLPAQGHPGQHARAAEVASQVAGRSRRQAWPARSDSAAISSGASRPRIDSVGSGSAWRPAGRRASASRSADTRTSRPSALGRLRAGAPRRSACRRHRRSRAARRRFRRRRSRRNAAPHGTPGRRRSAVAVARGVADDEV